MLLFPTNVKLSQTLPIYSPTHHVIFLLWRQIETFPSAIVTVIETDRKGHGTGSPINGCDDSPHPPPHDYRLQLVCGSSQFQSPPVHRQIALGDGLGRFYYHIIAASDDDGDGQGDHKLVKILHKILMKSISSNNMKITSLKNTNYWPDKYQNTTIILLVALIW